MMFEELDGESLQLQVTDLAISAGSACNSAGLFSSHVLHAIGVDVRLAKSACRFSFSRFSTMEDVDFAVGVIVEAVTKVRGMFRERPRRSEIPPSGARR